MLRQGQHFAESIAIYEKLLQVSPNNPNLLAALALTLSDQAGTVDDAREAKAIRKRARALAADALKHGSEDAYSRIVLSSIRPDGSVVPDEKGAFSGDASVEKFVREGEAAFRRHDYKAAIRAYEKALELEPSNYLATLFVGDCYFSLRDMPRAIEWFRKATEIDSTKETAHRYMGDALNKLGRHAEARNAWIAAVVADPYTRLTRQHFPPQLRARAEGNGRAIPRFPMMQSKLEGKELQLSINPNDGPLITVYNIIALGWRDTEFRNHFPAEPKPRRSLAEETAAIEAMIASANDCSEEDLAKWKSVVRELTRLKDEGLLQVYILLERADQDLAKDYAPFRDAHRSELEKYVRLYWCGIE